MVRIALLISVLLGVGCSADNPTVQASPSAPADSLEVRRGDFAQTLILSGELEAAEGAVISVPKLPSWQTTIQWLAPEGTEVVEGDRVAELDNSEFASGIEQKKSALNEADYRLRQRTAEIAATIAENEFNLRSRTKDLEKATLDATVPSELLSRRDYEDRQLALSRTKTEQEKAMTSLEAARANAQAELANLRLTFVKAQRELDTAENAIQMLVLRAPAPGILIVGEIPWEGRKMQSGDSVFVGMAIAQIPDLSTIQVVARLADVDEGKIAAGMPATIMIDAYPEKTFTGRIERISAVAQEVDPASLRRVFQVIIPIDEIDESLMRPGYSVRVSVERTKEANALLVPRASVDRSGEKPAVRLADGKSVEVDLGECNAFDCVIRSGIEEGARLASGTQRAAL
ncbi:MAG: efflux RND transporter periplasmic adaptor subunit [Acidobacteria bacterium]|nr:efflux RND transporter periplasmic adaptor subunit [Acidobacteriota bacterium]